MPAGATVAEEELGEVVEEGLGGFTYEFGGVFGGGHGGGEAAVEAVEATI